MNEENKTTDRHESVGVDCQVSKQKMISPGRCSFCGGIYDLTMVKPIHRYADCTLYRTPCCNKLADDREWKSLADFRRIDEIWKN